MPVRVSIVHSGGRRQHVVTVTGEFDMAIAGMVQRTPVKGISRYGRASQGVKLMNMREDDRVSAVALVAESQGTTEAKVQDELDDGSSNGSTPTDSAE